MIRVPGAVSGGTVLRRACTLRHRLVREFYRLDGCRVTLCSRRRRVYCVSASSLCETIPMTTESDKTWRRSRLSVPLKPGRRPAARLRN